MNSFKQEKHLLQKMIKTSLPVTAMAFLFFLMGTEAGIAAVAGTLLSALFILSSAWVLDTFYSANDTDFFHIFFFTLVLRFLGVLSLFAILLVTVKINQILFTVSFIISYLYNSVTETIFINKYLHKSSKKRP